MPFLLENVLGYGTRQVGLLMATVPLGIGVVAPVSGAISDRVGTRPITVIGLLCMLFGFYTMSTVGLETTTLGFVLSFLPVGVGMGIFQSPNNSAVMGSVPRQRLGVASGLLSITRTLGQTTGIAVIGALWASRTLFHHGFAVPEGATGAPAGAQVSGLHDTFLVIMGLLAFALGLSVWGLVQERRMRRMAAVQSGP
jgi:MFS family permease